MPNDLGLGFKVLKIEELLQTIYCAILIMEVADKIHRLDVHYSSYLITRLIPWECQSVNSNDPLLVIRSSPA